MSEKQSNTTVALKKLQANISQWLVALFNRIIGEQDRIQYDLDKCLSMKIMGRQVQKLNVLKDQKSTHKVYHIIDLLIG